MSIDLAAQVGAPIVAALEAVLEQAANTGGAIELEGFSAALTALAVRGGPEAPGLKRAAELALARAKACREGR